MAASSAQLREHGWRKTTGSRREEGRFEVMAVDAVEG